MGEIARNLLVLEICEIDRVELDAERVVLRIAIRHGRFCPYNIVFFAFHFDFSELLGRL